MTACLAPAAPSDLDALRECLVAIYDRTRMVERSTTDAERIFHERALRALFGLAGDYVPVSPPREQEAGDDTRDRAQSKGDN